MMTLSLTKTPPTALESTGEWVWSVTNTAQSRSCVSEAWLTWRRESTEMQTLQNPASINSYDFASAKVWISSCLLSYKGKCVVFVLRPPCGSVYLIRDVNTSLFPSHNITPASFSLLSKHLMVMQIKWAPLLSFEPSDADACSGLLVANQGSPQISWC